MEANGASVRNQTARECCAPKNPPARLCFLRSQIAVINSFSRWHAQISLPTALSRGRVSPLPFTTAFLRRCVASAVMIHTPNHTPNLPLGTRTNPFELDFYSDRNKGSEFIVVAACAVPSRKCLRLSFATRQEVCFNADCRLQLFFLMPQDNGEDFENKLCT